MKLEKRFAIMLFLPFFPLFACSSPAAAPTESSAVSGAVENTVAEAPTETEKPAATATAAKEELEILESFGWVDRQGEYLIEMLVRNPYDHPVWIKHSWVRLLDSAGQVLVDGDTYVGDGALMGGLGIILPGETVPASRCLSCGYSAVQETLQGLGDTWANTLSIGFVLEPTEPIAYSTDFDVLVSDFSRVGDVGTQYSIEGTVDYLGDQSLSSAYLRILLYDEDRNYVGWGEASLFADGIETGDELPFFTFLTSSTDGNLDYEITVIGRVAEELSAEDDFVLPVGTPLAVWEGIPVMTEAINGEARYGHYEFTTLATLGEIERFYESELADLGFVLAMTGEGDGGYGTLSFDKDTISSAVVVSIAPIEGLNLVTISIK